jgi:hypothetical protein
VEGIFFGGVIGTLGMMERMHGIGCWARIFFKICRREGFGEAWRSGDAGGSGGLGGGGASVAADCGAKDEQFFAQRRGDAEGFFSRRHCERGGGWMADSVEQPLVDTDWGGWRRFVAASLGPPGVKSFSALARGCGNWGEAVVRGVTGRRPQSKSGSGVSSNDPGGKGAEIFGGGVSV